MKAIGVLCCMISAGFAAPTNILLRTPSLDNSIVTIQRIGGAFAYSTAENAQLYVANKIPIGYAPVTLLNSYYDTHFLINTTPQLINPVVPEVVPEAAPIPESITNPPSAGIVPGATVDDDTVTVDSA